MAEHGIVGFLAALLISRAGSNVSFQTNAKVMAKAANGKYHGKGLPVTDTGGSRSEPFIVIHL